MRKAKGKRQKAKIKKQFFARSASALLPFAFCLLLFAFSLPLLGATLPAVQPSKVSVDAGRLAFIDGAVNDAIARKELPGAVVRVGGRGGVVWRKAYGSRAVVPQREAMTGDTVFDLASLTKVVATTTSVMILVERGKVRLGDPVSLYIPELKGEGREKITIEHLLTHCSGFAPDFDLGEQWSGYEEMLKRLYREPLRSAPGARFVYSDINFITLGEIVRRVSGQPLDEFARRNIYEPLGMRDTGFRRIGEGAGAQARNDAAAVARIAPTENVRGVKSYLGGAGEQGTVGEHILRGEVHDPTANRMGGVAG